MCRVRGTLVKLCFLLSKCNPRQRSCVSIAWNAGKVAFSDFQAQPFADIARIHYAECC